MDEMSTFELSPEHQHVPGEEMDESEEDGVGVVWADLLIETDGDGSGRR